MLMRDRNIDRVDGASGNGYGAEFSGARGMRGNMVSDRGEDETL
jgi:hypothetical protein